MIDERCISCVDEWNPGTCTIEAMRAYRALEDDRRVEIQRVEVGAMSGKVTIRYLSDLPHKNMIDLLRQVRQKLMTARQENGPKTLFDLLRDE